MQDIINDLVCNIQLPEPEPTTNGQRKKRDGHMNEHTHQELDERENWKSFGLNIGKDSLEELFDGQTELVSNYEADNKIKLLNPSTPTWFWIRTRPKLKPNQN